MFLFLKNNNIPVQDGDYYRLLTNGDYHVTASLDGYLSSTKWVTVVNKPHTEAKIINFTLEPVGYWIVLLYLYKS